MLNEIRGKATDEKTVRDMTDARSCKLSTELKMCRQKYSRGLVCMARQKLQAKKLINRKNFPERLLNSCKINEVYMFLQMYNIPLRPRNNKKIISCILQVQKKAFRMNIFPGKMTRISVPKQGVKNLPFPRNQAFLALSSPLRVLGKNFGFFLT